MNDIFIHQVLFPVIRRGLQIDNADILISESDYNNLIELGRRQDILPLIYRGIKELSVKNEWKRSLKELCFGEIYRYAIREDSLEQIRGAFDKAEIPYIPLKGSIICHLYPEAWMRTSYDIDVLIHESDLPKAIEILEYSTEFKRIKRNYHDVTMSSKTSLLELHFSIMENMENIDLLLRKAWLYAEPTGEGFMYRFKPEFQIFHIIAHLAYHMINGGGGIRNFIDLWILQNRTVYNEAALRKLCDECSILKFYDSCCDLSNVWFGRQQYDERTRMFERYCLQGGALGSSKIAGAGRQRKYKGFSYMYHRLFVNRSVLEEMYPMLRRLPFLLFGFQVKRWFRLLNKNTRKRATREINNTKRIEGEAIDAYDRFLRKIGL